MSNEHGHFFWAFCLGIRAAKEFLYAIQLILSQHAVA